MIHSLADLSKASEYLGYAPRIKLVEGLERTVAWYRDGKAFEATPS